MSRTIGHYRVGRQPGRGGTREVFLADDLSLGRKVALKFLPDPFAADPERLARFERRQLECALNESSFADLTLQPSYFTGTRCLSASNQLTTMLIFRGPAAVGIAPVDAGGSIIRNRCLP